MWKTYTVTVRCKTIACAEYMSQCYEPTDDGHGGTLKTYQCSSDPHKVFIEVAARNSVEAKFKQWCLRLMMKLFEPKKESKD